MKTKNVVQLVGCLKDNPVLHKKTGSVTKFVLVTSKEWTDKETKEKKESFEYHFISCFNELAEIAVKCLKKDFRVYVSGSLKTSKWPDEQNVERYKTEIIAEDFFIAPSYQPSGEIQ